MMMGAMKTIRSEFTAQFVQMLAAASIFSVRSVWDDEQLAKLQQILSGRGSRADLYLRYEQCWGVSCDVTVSFKRDWDARKTDKFATYNVTCQLGWSSTGRNVADATAAAALYTKCAQLAALFESAFAEIELTDVPVSKEV